MASVRTLEDSTIPTKLDATDWKILAELQRDGRITNVELAARVGLSAPPCLRRVRELERTGIIAGYHAVFNLPRLGFHLTAFAFVRLESQSEADLSAFEARIRQWEIVREAFMLSGDTDFLLKCVAPDLVTFQNFIIRELTAAPNVSSVKTSFTIKTAKSEPGAAIE
ncbi:Lrp/AsnC family transcriptional regulator [Rhodomicrobium sp. Az07]|uniref:Lrp/AsnC family transcriptional regulator n=1 Tax=Rhodomicrobium sp. Az07 TaxID=2839034 RepID=UPI001BE7B2EA|nr:Lrp/AsnC family transcriptional regulator [Rhodomicrobium sp. Az07]MBT3070547.1 Lrp/AsnC family transcriptional regulator [Rhodomicrobium sp. Az07]